MIRIEPRLIIPQVQIGSLDSLNFGVPLPANIDHHGSITLTIEFYPPRLSRNKRKRYGVSLEKHSLSAKLLCRNSGVFISVRRFRRPEESILGIISLLSGKF